MTAFPARASNSHVALYAALINAVIIVFLSLYPFHGWRYSGRPLLEFLFDPLPFYTSSFDNAANVLIYIPYGFCLALLLLPRWLSLLFAVCVAGLTSFGMEFTQQFLPSRVASNLDLLCNVSGAALGATLAISSWLRRYWHHLWQWRRRHFVADSAADYGLLVMGLWFFTQLNPALPLFGVVAYPQGLPQPYLSPIDNPRLFLFLLEAGGAASNMLAVNLFLTAFLLQRRDSGQAILWVVVSAWLLKLFAAGALLKPFAFFQWVNPHLVTGLAAGFLLSWLFARSGRMLQTLVALLALAAAQAAAVLWPLSQVQADFLSLFRWPYGHLHNMNALVDFLADLWPLLALACLLFSIWQQSAIKRQPG
ncbi:VanZ family protein [Vogesella sp. LIG4]|uniref:VanZ family protein n=1 Tax=Vogesella sp. LIG4 TaxID=1192162 RepID=UPI0008200199|nr:VanZ family protein [Vogesella sp. LIG4]SCK09707.1 Glycopeptide antibiotics resistance protein [Vogesella sp. LIG4]